MISICLDHMDMALAASVGVERHIKAMAAGRKNAHGLSDNADLWGIHIEGAAAEFAFAKALHLSWDRSTDPDKFKGDVEGYQVRLGRGDAYHLVVRKNDPDEHIFVLVTGRCPNFNVVGWIRAIEGKNPAFWTSKGGRAPQFYVPQSALRPINAASALAR